MTTQDEVLEYARRIKIENPSITEDDLRAILVSQFLPRGFRTNAINNPLDWFAGLAGVFSGLFKLFQDEPDESGIKDIIEGVIRIVAE